MENLDRLKTNNQSLLLFILKLTFRRSTLIHTRYASVVFGFVRAFFGTFTSWGTARTANHNHLFELFLKTNNLLSYFCLFLKFILGRLLDPPLPRYWNNIFQYTCNLRKTPYETSWPIKSILTIIIYYLLLFIIHSQTNLPLVDTHPLLPSIDCPPEKQPILNIMVD